MLGMLEDDLKEIIGVDVEGVNPRNNLFGFLNDNWKGWWLDNDLEVLVPEKFNITEDEKGDMYIYPEGDTSVAPSGHMPRDGAAEPFLSLFIEAGFDVINPVQCSAAGMDPKHLKEKYGDKLTCA